MLEGQVLTGLVGWHQNQQGWSLPLAAYNLCLKVVAGFSATAQSLLETPTKSMTEAKKISKRYWQQQIGARLGDFKGALEKREGGGNGKGGKPRTPEQRVRDNLNDCLKVINAVEDPKQLTKGENIAALVKQAIALLPSK